MKHETRRSANVMRRNTPSRVRSKSELSARRACVVSVPRIGPLSPAGEGMPRKGVCEEWRHKWGFLPRKLADIVYWGTILARSLGVFLCVFVCEYRSVFDQIRSEIHTHKTQKNTPPKEIRTGTPKGSKHTR